MSAFWYVKEDFELEKKYDKDGFEFYGYQVENDGVAQVNYYAKNLKDNLLIIDGKAYPCKTVKITCDNNFIDYYKDKFDNGLKNCLKELFVFYSKKAKDVFQIKCLIETLRDTVPSKFYKEDKDFINFCVEIITKKINTFPPKENQELKEFLNKNIKFKFNNLIKSL